jgi:hypothetical protein
LEAVYVYGDGHAELGFRVFRLFPGVSLALWKAGTGVWEAAKGEQLAPYPDFEEDFSHFQFNQQGRNWHAVFVWLLDAATGWSGRWRPRCGQCDACRAAGFVEGEYPEGTKPPELVIRYDGLLLLPGEGEWKVMARGGVRRYLWLDADGNDRPDKSEVEEHQGEATGQETVSRCSVVKPDTFCRFRFIVQQGSTHPAPGLWRVGPEGTEELIDYRSVYSCPN